MKKITINPIIKKAEKRFRLMLKTFGVDPYGLASHVEEASKWARLMLKKYPKADKEVVMLSVWLHDIGHYSISRKADHAAIGERRAKEFLKKEKYPEEKAEAVLHCVRSHRCRDVMPRTLEARIIAFIDSASHVTDTMYFDMARVDKSAKKKFRAYAKMQRDLREFSLFPKEKKKLTGLFKAWKVLIKEYEKINLG